MEWTRTSLLLTIILIPGVALFVVVTLGCLLAYLNPSCHFTWRCGKCWEMDGVGRRARPANRSNEYSPANAQAIQMQPKRPAPRLAAQAAVPGSPQTVEVRLVVESIEVQIEPQQN